MTVNKKETTLKCGSDMMMMMICKLAIVSCRTWTESVIHSPTTTYCLYCSKWNWKMMTDQKPNLNCSTHLGKKDAIHVLRVELGKRDKEIALLRRKLTQNLSQSLNAKEMVSLLFVILPAVPCWVRGNSQQAVPHSKTPQLLVYLPSPQPKTNPWTPYLKAPSLFAGSRWENRESGESREFSKRWELQPQVPAGDMQKDAR